MGLRFILSLLCCYLTTTVEYSMGKGDDYEIAEVPKYASRSETGHKIPVVPSESRAQYYIKNEDGTYSYGYDTGSGIYEMAKKTGVNDVKGIYGFSYPDGRTTKVSYIAGGESGFVPKIEESRRKILKSTTPNLGASFPRHNFDFISDSPKDSKNLKTDSSYRFQYRNAERSRKETADADLNVSGEYSFVADDGIRRTVKYKGGSDTGFVVDADFISSDEKTRALQSPSTYDFQRDLKYVSKGQHQDDSKDPKPDGSYNFQYRNADSSRKETADADLNVAGEYSFVADDGIRRTVKYKAGSDTGFVVDADFISPDEKTRALQSPSTYGSQRDLKYVARGEYQDDSKGLKPDGSYSFQYRNADSSRKETADADLNVEGEYSFIADDGIRRTVKYKAGSNTGFIVDADFISFDEKTRALQRPSTYGSQRDLKYVSRGEYQDDSKGLKPDGSYSFQYRNADSSRKETADADLNVEGEYSFIADDGIRRTVKYKAGSNTGFVVDADFISSNEKTRALQRPSTFGSQRDLKYVSRGEYQDDSKGIKPDGSHSFQYRNADSSRKETANADLNVDEEYSFVADDGIRRTVKYQAGSNTGFVVDADYIPSDEKIPALQRPFAYGSQKDLKNVSRGGFQNDSNDLKPDGSYVYRYKNADNYRKETSDATSSQHISSRRHASTINSNPIPKYVSLNDEQRNSNDSKLEDRDGSYHITKDRSRKEVVSVNFNSLNTYSFIDSQGYKNITSGSDNIFFPRTASPLRSARDYQTFMNRSKEDEHFHFDTKKNSDSNTFSELGFQKQSSDQIINHSNINSEPPSSSTKYLVGNVLLKKYATGPERGYVFTAA